MPSLITEEELTRMLEIRVANRRSGKPFTIPMPQDEDEARRQARLMLAAEQVLDIVRDIRGDTERKQPDTKFIRAMCDEIFKLSEEGAK